MPYTHVGEPNRQVELRLKDEKPEPKVRRTMSPAAKEAQDRLQAALDDHQSLIAGYAASIRRAERVAKEIVEDCDEVRKTGRIRIREHTGVHHLVSIK